MLLPADRGAYSATFRHGGARSLCTGNHVATRPQRRELVIYPLNLFIFLENNKIYINIFNKNFFQNTKKITYKQYQHSYIIQANNMRQKNF